MKIRQSSLGNLDKCARSFQHSLESDASVTGVTLLVAHSADPTHHIGEIIRREVDP